MSDDELRSEAYSAIERAPRVIAEAREAAEALKNVAAAWDASMERQQRIDRLTALIVGLALGLLIAAVMVHA